MESVFKILLQKEIYEFLEGSAHTNLVAYKGLCYGKEVREESGSDDWDFDDEDDEDDE